MEKKDVWTTSDIITNRNNWSLASDAELLKHLQALSEKIFTKANATLRSLNAFENDVNQTCISVANTNNKFKALSDTQFIESKVQDESLDVDEPSGSQNKSAENVKHENTTVQLKEALENGFQVLDTQYDIIPVDGSDSEDDEPQEILLKVRNPYLTRRLPYIIGSEEFTRNDNLGLVDSSSSEASEEDEEDEQSDDEEEEIEEKKTDEEIDSEEEKYVIPKPTPKTEFIRPQTQVIRISDSDSEDSEISISSSKSSKKGETLFADKDKPVEKPKENDVQTPYNFADHLSAALRSGIGNPFASVPPDFADTFSPPPFPGKDANDTDSDEDPSDSSVDMFASKKNVKHSNTTSLAKSHNYDDESDDNSRPWRNNDIDVISREPPVLGKMIQSSRKPSVVGGTSQHSDSSCNPPIGDDLLQKDDRMTQPAKSKIGESNINSLNKKMVTAINAELNEKLKIKTNANKPEIPTKSSKPSKPPNEQPSPISVKKEVKKPVLFDELDNKSDTEIDNSNDLFSGLLHSKKASSKNTKSSGLFDDEDDIDNLFKPSKPTASNSAKKPDQDLFSNKAEKSRESEPMAKPVTIDLFKKSDLFASDSDSEDDIFSIIKGKQKTTPKTDIFKKGNFGESQNIEKSVEKSTLTKDSASGAKSTPQKPPISTKKDADVGQTKTNDVTKTSIFEDSSKKVARNLFQSRDDDDDLFSKKNSTDKRTVPDISKSNDLFADKTEIERSKPDNASFFDSFISADQNRGIGNEDAKNTLSNESLKVDKSTGEGDIFAKNFMSRCSSSSEDDDIEPVKDSMATSQNDNLPSEKIPPKERKDRKDIFTENLFGEKIPPMDQTSKDDLEDDLFGEKFQKKKKIEGNVLEEDLFREKSDPVMPSADENIFEDDLFEKKSHRLSHEKRVNVKSTSDDLSTEKSQSIIFDKKSQSDNLFDNASKSSEHFSVKRDDLFDENLDSLKPDPTEGPQPSSEKPQPSPSIEEPEKIVESTPESDLFSIKNDISSKPKEDFSKNKDAGLFNFSKKDLFGSDSDSDDLDFIETSKTRKSSTKSEESKKPPEPEKKLVHDNKSPDFVKNDRRIFDADDDSDLFKISKASEPCTKLEESKRPSPPPILKKKPIQSNEVFSSVKDDTKISDSDDDLDILKTSNPPKPSVKPEESKKPSSPPILSQKPSQGSELFSSVKDDTKISDSDDDLDFLKTSNPPKPSVKPEESKKPSSPPILSKKPGQGSELFSSAKDDTKISDSDDDLDFLKTSSPPKSFVKPEESKKPSPPSILQKTSIRENEPTVSSVKDQIKKLSQSSEENDSKQSSPKVGRISSVFDQKKTTDEQDGNIFTKTSPEPTPPTRHFPGKLATSRKLNINVNALLPGTNWSSKIKQKVNENEPVIANETESVPEQATNLLNNVTKERAKISGKRRPPSRQARKSRIFSDDLFASTVNVATAENRDEDVLRHQPPPLPRPEKKSPIPSPRLSLTGSEVGSNNEDVESKKPQALKGDIFTDELLTNDDQMNDLFQTIGRTMRENAKSFGETNKGPSPPSMPSSLASSKDSESDSEFSFGITPAPSSLPSLTKGRAKPQRRTVSSRKPAASDPLDDAGKDEPIEPITKTVEKSNITDEIASTSTPIKTASSSNTVESTAKSLFDNLDDDDYLFGTTKPKNTAEKPKPKVEVKRDPVQPLKSQTAKKSTIDIFNDDDGDELFVSTKTKLSGNKISKKSFLFEDNDDDDLFGKSTSRSNEKAKDPLLSSTKTKVSGEKPRIVKLRSETVQKDPLTGRDITDLR